MKRILESRREIRTSAFSSPGTPKMYSTPSASRHRRNRSLAFMGKHPPPRPILAGRGGDARQQASGAARLQVERDRVHAVALTRRLRTVVEDVPEVAAAAPAPHLGAHHPVRAVLDQLDRLRRLRLVEARPTGSAVELGRRVEQL